MARTFKITSTLLVVLMPHTLVGFLASFYLVYTILHERANVHIFPVLVLLMKCTSQMKRFVLRCLAFSIMLLTALVVIGLIVPYNSDGYMREQFIKDKLLQASDRPNTIILVGGSNTAFGYNSSKLVQDTKLPVINMGLHAGLGLKFIIDNIVPYTHKGDIVVISPEYDHFFEDIAYGSQPLADLFYLSPSRYISNLSAAQFFRIAENTGSFLRSKVEYLAASILVPSYQSVYRLSSFNKYGDVVAHWKTDDKRYEGVGNAHFEPRKGNIRYIHYLCEELKAMQERGVEVILYPPVIAESVLHAYELDIHFVTRVLTDSGFPFVCLPAEVAQPDSMFYDTPYHLREEGANRHSAHLAHIIKQLRPFSPSGKRQ